MRATSISFILAVTACGTERGPANGPDGTKPDANAAGGTAAGGAPSGGGAGAGVNTGGRDTHSGAGGAAPGSGGGVQDASTPGDGAGGAPIVRGGPGCGLPSAAFCDTFEDERATKGARAAELDATRWSAGRLAPQLPSGNG